MMNRTAAFFVMIFSWTVLSGQGGNAPYTSNFKSYLRIDGQTNISRFNLQQVIGDQAICNPDNSSWIYNQAKKRYEIYIPVREFRASNKMIYTDFLTLVNSGTHPDIIVHIGKTDFINLFNSYHSARIPVGITVAGKTRIYNIQCALSRCEGNSMIIQGLHQLNLTDFKLEPPSKTLGLIHVKNELIVKFEFRLPYNSTAIARRF
jgi:hypothetical protein